MMNNCCISIMLSCQEFKGEFRVMHGIHDLHMMVVSRQGTAHGMSFAPHIYVLNQRHKFEASVERCFWLTRSMIGAVRYYQLEIYVWS